MKYIYDTDTDKFIGPLTTLEKSATTYEMSSDDVAAKIQPTIDTGLIPCTESGLVSYRTKAGYEQIVLQICPGMYVVKWGVRERDVNAKLYEMAMPYRIIIADFDNGVFLGLRHFFTMSPAYTLDTPLYATPFANTNNLGYRETSVGWVCLYHTRNTPFTDLSEKIDYCITRESGFNEPYNDVNMSRTDGPIFYQKFMPDKEHFHSKVKWASWSKKDKLKNVLDPNLYIQYRVEASATAYAPAHVPQSKAAAPYTLGNAMHLNYAPYYGKTAPKPINSDKDVKASQFSVLLSRADKSKTLKWTPPVAKVEKKLPSKLDAAKKLKDHILDGVVCKSCKNIYPVGTVLSTFVSHWENNDITSFVKDQMCSDCRKILTVPITIPGWGNEYVHKTALAYSQTFEVWVLPQTAVACPECDDVCPTDQAHNFLVYGKNLDYPICCLNCVVPVFEGIPADADGAPKPEDILDRDVRYNKLCYNKYLTVVDAVGSDGGKGLGIQKAFAHVSYAEKVCACGFFVDDPENECVKEKNENGTLTCLSCVSLPLINIEKVNPVAITTAKDAQ